MEQAIKDAAVLAEKELLEAEELERKIAEALVEKERLEAEEEERKQAEFEAIAEK